MSWVAFFIVFLVAHIVGDYIFQTDFQAAHKHGGLGRDPIARRALFGHVATYAVAIAGACAWIASVRPAGLTVLVGVAVVLEHLIQDDGRLLAAYCRRVKASTSSLRRRSVSGWTRPSTSLRCLARRSC